MFVGSVAKEVMLQEITLSSEQLSILVAKFGYKAETNIDINDKNAMGTGLVWKNNLPVSEVLNIVECRGQELRLGDYSFVKIYAPSGSQNKQSRKNFFGQDIFRLIRGLGKTAPILGGDFNCILSPKDTEKNYADKKCPALKELVDSFDYSDSFRELNPDAEEFTFCRPNSAASRLDRYYVPQYLINNVKSVTHHASLGDHKYVVMIIDLPSVQKVEDQASEKSSYWKLNTSILKDEDFLENFSTFYQKIQAKINDYTDIADWWDICAKPAIKNCCIGVSSHLAHIRNDTKKYLFSYLNLVLKQRDWKEVARIRQEIKNILLLESMGFIVRSRFQENSEAEIASLFHTNREKKNSSKNNLDSLKIGRNISDNKVDIEAEVINYFGALFNGHHDRNLLDTGQPFVPDNSGLPDFLADLGKLSPESQASLAKDLSFAELEDIVMNECDNNKSPGLDGLNSIIYCDPHL